MKHEEVIGKAIRTFQDDEEDALLRLAILKERADYRKFFTPELRKAVESARAKIEKGNAKGPGYIPDERTSDTLADFRGELLHRFGIRDALPTRHNHPPLGQALDLLDPRTDAGEIPEAVRRSALTRLFYTPGVREVIPASVPARRGRGEAPWRTSSPDCAPYERLWKIDLRKKPAQLLRELKAVLSAVDAHRGMDPGAYAAWKQDRSRKREEAWQHLKVWRLRRQIPKPSFPEIARGLHITPAATKKSFYRAYEMIYGEPFDLKAWEKDRAGKPPKTCSNCPQREGCTEPCPEIFEEKKSTREYLTENIAKIGDSHSYNEWLTREEGNE
jgi:hypothetical protein